MKGIEGHRHVDLNVLQKGADRLTSSDATIVVNYALRVPEENRDSFVVGAEEGPQTPRRIILNLNQRNLIGVASKHPANTGLVEEISGSDMVRDEFIRLSNEENRARRRANEQRSKNMLVSARICDRIASENKEYRRRLMEC